MKKNLDGKILIAVTDLATKDDIPTVLDDMVVNRENKFIDLIYLVLKIFSVIIVLKIIWFFIHCSIHWNYLALIM